MIAVFARPNHPHYYTSGPGVGRVDSVEWMYHGYVVIFVRCVDYKQALEVKMKLATSGLPEPMQAHESYEQGWYGGRMDLLALLDGDSLHELSHMVSAPIMSYRAKQSIGDNRYTGFYDASELLRL